MVTILIIEDEKAISNLIYISLSREGYNCTCAFDGKQGADFLEERHYDLVLLDIMLPEIDGYELLEYIKPTETPVIFITAKGSLDDRVKGLRLGADDYIVKPFQIGELMNLLDNAVKAGAQHAVAGDDEGKKDDKPEEKPAEPEEPKPAGTTVVIVAEDGGKVNVRVGNDTSYKRITTVPAGTTFEYVATAANGWHAVIATGQVGWVSSMYSKVV